ncbi:MAG: rhomboid family intramembrane serine protease [Treponema sp.]|jgi:membrane associated rhomboid family serine protease|nr:rhomboid family intramembrane serine protease [Treponema sp.]
MSIIRQPFRYRNDGAVFWIIGINIVIFMAMYFLGRNFRELMTAFLAMIPQKVLHGWIWTFVTYMFVHDGFSHIFFNMFALFIFGVPVERQMGSREFLLFYFVTGTLAGIFSFFVYVFTGAYWVALVGASGAIFAVELAYAVFFPDSIIYIWGILPLRAPVMVLGFTALELIFSFTARNSGVAHFTHLAGFAFAWIYFLVRFGVNPWRRLFRR